MHAWENFLAMQEKEIGKETVKKWLRPLKVVRFDACNLYLEASDSFQALWFEEHIRPLVSTHLLNNNNKQIKVHLSVVSHQKESVQDRSKKTFSVIKSPAFSLYFDEVNPNYTFEKYVCSQANLLPLKIVSELCNYDYETKNFLPSERLQPSFNPIFLYGKSGSGKTHLLMSIVNALEKSRLKVIYARAETFTEHVVNAIRSGEMQTFRKAYRNIDVLLIDDVEVFSRKSATQEELFHTFNTLHVEGKQIILTSSFLPQELKFIEPRLISRFEWGIVLSLDILSADDQKKLLNQWINEMGYPMQDKVASFLLETFCSNPKELRKALDALILRTHLNQSIGQPPQLPLNLATAKNYLSDLIQEKESTVLTHKKIIQTVAEHYGIKAEDILSKSQNRESSLPRQIAMHLCRQQLNLPYMKIGDIFSRDHSTVMASVKQIQKQFEIKESEIHSTLNSIVKKLESVS